MSLRPNFRLFRTGYAVFGIVALATATALAADWPQWRGPDRTGVSRETGLLKAWPAGGPKLAWKATNLGEGYTAPSVANGRIYGMGLRGNEEVVWALDERTGNEIWHTRIAAGARLSAQQGGNGPRATPTVDGNLIYAMGASGDLACLNVADGKIRWAKSLVRDFGGEVPDWGYCESPLVDGEKVVVTPGGGAATLVALNKTSGSVIWKTQITQRNNAAYSSCIAADVDGQRQYIQFMAAGVLGVSAQDGRYLWEYDAPANNSGINCATPIYRDHMVFAASNYGNGGGAARLAVSGGKATATPVYFTKQMQNHHGGVVLVGDYLYGFDNSTLTCIEFKTGKIMWTNRSVGKGSLISADGFLYVRSENGPVALVEANPSGYVERGRFDQPERSRTNSWPYPVVANGKLYLRDQDILLCYNIK